MTRTLICASECFSRWSLAGSKSIGYRLDMTLRSPICGMLSIILVHRELWWFYLLAATFSMRIHCGGREDAKRILFRLDIVYYRSRQVCEYICLKLPRVTSLEGAHPLLGTLSTNLVCLLILTAHLQINFGKELLSGFSLMKIPDCFSARAFG